MRDGTWSTVWGDTDSADGSGDHRRVARDAAMSGNVRRVCRGSEAPPPRGERHCPMRARACHGRNSVVGVAPGAIRSEEHTSELQSLMRISYAVFCLRTTKNQKSL